MFSLQRIHREAGFSIIEAAIAIVILGAVFMMVLKASAFVDTMRAFLAGYQIHQAKIGLYAAEHHYLPGDDPNAPRKFGRPPAVTMQMGATLSHTGNDEIDGLLADVVNANGEHFMAWRDLRYAGLIDGDPELAGASALPQNEFGGVYGFDEGNLGQKAGSLCLTRVPGRAAEMIDRRIDDGRIDTGVLVGTSQSDPAGKYNHFEKPDSQPYDVDREYIICAPIRP